MSLSSNRLSRPAPRSRCLIGAGALPVVALCLLACDEGPAAANGDPPGDAEAVELELVAEGFDRPVHLAVAPGDTTRVFVVEQAGRIRVVRSGEVLGTPFLDVSGLITSGGERGLLSVAFHPEHGSNGRLFAFYTDPSGDARVVEYRVGSDPDVADPGSARVVLEVDQPFTNHNGGLVAFGPDGYLYVGLGDGGGSGDPLDQGQNAATLLGSILRIDVDGSEPYAIPPDNPFVGHGEARPEIWAYGLRNPWRFGFDPGTGDLYIADVGERRWEEVNVEPEGAGGGINYGWNIMEASECFGGGPCDTTGLALPVYEYRTNVEGCSVTGGEVYRGERLPELEGLYFFGDYCEGWIRSFRYVNGEARDVRDWAELGTPGNITSFGTDGRGELYVLTHQGRIYRLAPTGG